MAEGNIVGMNRSFVINPELLDAYVKRELKPKKLMIILIMGFFALLFVVLTRFSAISFFLGAVFGVIGLLAYASSKNGAENLAQSLQITITDDAVIKNHVRDQLDSFTKFGMEVNSMRFGTKFDIVIPYGKIKYTEIDENEIVIAKDEFSFDGDNKIKIPKECNGFSDIVNHIKSNPQLFNFEPTL